MVVSGLKCTSLANGIYIHIRRNVTVYSTLSGNAQYRQVCMDKVIASGRLDYQLVRMLGPELIRSMSSKYNLGAINFLFSSDRPNT